ncbi:MAG: response regulator transcription factor [Magnetococcales bacterium]|nr:response regulator transcription factor [Magnetococcales bacterium]
MINIVLADDHAIFLQGLSQLIQSEADIEIVGQAGDGQSAWDLIQEKHPDVAVLDITMAGLNGIEISRRVEQSKDVQSNILLLTMHEDPLLALEARHAGAKGYVLKENTFEDLVNAIRLVNTGETFVTKIIADKITQLEKFGGTLILSGQEREVLRGIAKGMTNKEIARQMSISPKTVETYRNRIMDKLNLRSIAELSRFAVKLGLVE